MAYDDADLAHLAATLRASENPDWQPQHDPRIAAHVAPDRIRAYFYQTIPGTRSIRRIPGSLGQALHHTLIWTRPGRPHAYLETWNLDAAGVDPARYIASHAPKWVRQSLDSSQEDTHR